MHDTLAHFLYPSYCQQAISQQNKHIPSAFLAIERRTCCQQEQYKQQVSGKMMSWLCLASHIAGISQPLQKPGGATSTPLMKLCCGQGSSPELMLQIACMHRARYHCHARFSGKCCWRLEQGEHLLVRPFQEKEIQQGNLFVLASLPRNQHSDTMCLAVMCFPSRRNQGPIIPQCPFGCAPAGPQRKRPSS